MINNSFTVDSTWKPRGCPACSATASKLLFFKQHLPFVQCYICKSVFVNPVPPDEALHQMYEAYGEYYFKDTSKLDLDFNPTRYWREWSAIPVEARRGRLLDVGCATGSFLALALSSGFEEVRGIDISSPAVAYANRHLGEDLALAANFLDQPFPADHFDVVTLWATLEHVADAAGFIREARRVLKPAGLLCLSVPNRMGLSMRLLGPRYHMVGLEHLNYFSPRGLNRLVQNMGFRVVQVQTRSFNPVGFCKDYRGRHILGEMKPPDLLADRKHYAALRTNKAIRLLEKTVDRSVKLLGLGDLLIVTARKRW